MSDSLGPNGLQHARLPCSSPTPRACSNSCPSSQWCYPTNSSCHPLLLLPSVLPSIRVFSNESDLRIRWSKYWSFSFSVSPSSEYSGLISFRINWSESKFSLFKIFYKQAICMVSFRKHYLISSLCKRVKSFIIQSSYSIYVSNNS